MGAWAIDPLTDPRPLIERVYAYVAYRIGDGPEAEDVTSEVFERALRYRKSYDPARGRPLTWLLGIAARCVQGQATRVPSDHDVPDSADQSDLENDAIRRLSVMDMVSKLDVHNRELLALRYGADLTARQMAEILGMKTNAVEVALYRVLELLRRDVAQEAVERRRPLGTSAADAIRHLLTWQAPISSCTSAGAYSGTDEADGSPESRRGVAG